MLAQNFKTPTALGISDIEFEALVKVLGMLERGDIRYSTKGNYSEGPKSKLAGFNMWSFYADHACGTIGCICGWAEDVGGLPPYSLVLKHTRTGKCAGLDSLFQGEQVVFDYGSARITPAQAAIALRNFLTHGEPRWAEALAD